jgi:hypothetical protein
MIPIQREPEGKSEGAVEEVLLIDRIGEARDGSRGKGAAFEPPSPASAGEAWVRSGKGLLRMESERA